MPKTLNDAVLTDTRGFDDASGAAAKQNDTGAGAAGGEGEGADAGDGGEGEGDLVDAGAGAAGSEGEGAEGAGEGGEGEGDGKPAKPKNPVEERIKGALRQRDEARGALQAEKEAKAALEARLATIEARLSGGGAGEGTQQQEKPAPNPADYEYGSLDDKYISDMIDYRAGQMIDQHFSRLDQSRQEQQLEQQVNTEIARVQEQAKDIVVKGAAVFDDFEEVVWERGLREEYKLDKPTFDAVTEADNPVEIMYALASDPAEALRVFQMTPAQQAKYVFGKDREISEQKAKSPRAPKAPPPAGNAVRGAGGRYGVAGDTEDLDAFEKEFFKKK